MTQIGTSAFGAAAIAATGGPVSRPAANEERAALVKAAQAFEAIFTRQLLGTMRQAGLGEDIAGSSAVDQFRELADAKMADGLSQQGGLGIANLILQQLDRKTP